MEHQHDSIRHLKYLRQSLSQDNESIGFFLSAGCPLAVQMPAGGGPLIPDVAGLSKLINTELGKNPKYITLLSELKKAGKNEENIEDTLSFVRSLHSVSRGGEVRGFNQSDLDELDKSICKKIVSRLDVRLPNDESPYHKLCRWMKSIDRKVAIEIFTTNYDLLTEQALEDMSVPYFDGFVGSRRSFFDLRAIEDNKIPAHWSRLWKIHGSINWVQEDVDGTNRISRRSEVKLDASHLIYPSHLKYEESRKMPYLALMDQLSRFLRRKSSLLIMSGYSFNDGHINDTIVNALTANPTAMVLGMLFGNYQKKDSTGGDVDSYPEAYKLANNQHNLNIWCFDKAIIGTNLGLWSSTPKDVDDPDSDLQQFVTFEKATGKTDQKLVKMGDFRILANFLQKIIGSRQGGLSG